ncbi:hypothetical protein EDB83DRAFT_2322211 [Lactarius deliciosus]|nr:hypothetical protein EDB83DRAFT_2322211 [Lactarius deliciosus]
MPMDRASISTDFPNSPSHCVSGAIRTIGSGEEMGLEKRRFTERPVDRFRPVFKAAYVDLFKFPLSVCIARGDFSSALRSVLWTEPVFPKVTVRRCLPIGELFLCGKLLGSMGPRAVIVDFSQRQNLARRLELLAQVAQRWPMAVFLVLANMRIKNFRDFHGGPSRWAIAHMGSMREEDVARESRSAEVWSTNAMAVRLMLGCTLIDLPATFAVSLRIRRGVRP